jgi:hypothetical protein
MTILYTPTSGTPYDFERGIGDVLEGNMPTYLPSKYRNVDVALLTGVMSIKIADGGAPFTLQCTLNNSELGVDADLSGDAKFDLLKALEGTVGTLAKDGLTCTNVQFKNVTKQSRVVSYTAYPVLAADQWTITASILFEKLDA